MGEVAFIFSSEKVFGVTLRTRDQWRTKGEPPRLQKGASPQQEVDFPFSFIVHILLHPLPPHQTKVQTTLTPDSDPLPPSSLNASLIYNESSSFSTHRSREFTPEFYQERNVRIWMQRIQLHTTQKHNHEIMGIKAIISAVLVDHKSINVTSIPFHGKWIFTVIYMLSSERR